MKKILIITNYFPPEIGAASNRIFHLAEGLSESNFNVEVLTPLPNYPTGKIFDGYKGAFKIISVENKITVKRLWIFASNSKNKFLRLFSMVSYSFSLVWFFMWHKIPERVIIQSPPLLVAFTSLFFLNSKKHTLILNVSDLWPSAGLELGAFKRGFSYRLLEKIEHYNYKKADLVLGQSEEILEHVKSLHPEKNLFLYRNYPDFKTPNISSSKPTQNPIKIVYAGLLGIAQGIYKLIQNLDYSNIELHIYGNGTEQELIKAYLKKNTNLPITYHGEVTRKQLHTELMQYDLVIIPLLNRIYGSVPSKIFEYARLGLPMLYFGGGEGETIITRNQLGWIAESGNYNDLKRVISSIKKEELTFRKKIQQTAVREFDFESQLQNLIKVL